MKRWKMYFVMFMVALGSVFTMTPVHAQTISASQTITITAYVAPARSIIVNDAGAITKIYSNTDQSITPRVFIDEAHSRELPLTTELRTQYDAIIAERTNLIGVEIPVEPPKATNDSVQKILFGVISTFLMKF